MEMSELEFYAWYAAHVLLLFVVNLVTTLPRIRVHRAAQDRRAARNTGIIADRHGLVIYGENPAEATRSPGPRPTAHPRSARRRPVLHNGRSNLVQRDNDATGPPGPPPAALQRLQPAAGRGALRGRPGAAAPNRHRRRAARPLAIDLRPNAAVIAGP